MTTTQSAITAANIITANAPSVRHIVQMFDLHGARFSKNELQAVAADRGLNTAGNRSALCFRIAQAAQR